MRKRAVLATLLTLGFITLPAPTPSQAAVPCATSRYTDRANDFARITDATGGCKTVSVRHQYTLSSASKDHWTDWVKKPDVATTKSRPELVAAQFGSTQA